MLSLCFSVAISGCASKAFIASPIESATFIERAITQKQETVSVTAAVPSAEETISLIGLNLYAQGIQPVWLQAENRGEEPVRVALWSIDEAYFSPMEVAWKNRKAFSHEGRAAMERWFYENQMQRRIPPGETRSGFIFTNMSSGTKGFNVDVFASDRAFPFTFFVPIPGFHADYMDVNFQSLYRKDEIQKLDIDSLRSAIEAHPCCSTDESGTSVGDPFNVVLVGSPLTVRRSLLRGGWQETAADSSATVLARTHRYRGRQPDGTFHKSRPDGRERKELRVWLSPMQLGDDPVWIAQVSYDMSGATGSKAFEKYRIDPDIDDARMFILQNFWYSQSLARMGEVGGIPSTTIDAPHRNFGGSEYFTDGQRIILFLSESPVALDETIMLQWRRLDNRWISW
jgi:hypothetical protein